MESLAGDKQGSFYKTLWTDKLLCNEGQGRQNERCEGGMRLAGCWLSRRDEVGAQIALAMRSGQ